MFTVEQCEVSRQPVTQDRFQIAPKKNHVLFICVVNFTPKARELTFDQIRALGFSAAQSKKMNDFAEKLQWETGLIGPADLAYKLKSGTPIRCELMPRSDGPAQSVTVKSPDGHSAHWTTLGRISTVASLPVGQTPVALVWGKKYEAAIPPL
jgi:hypothetical protein